MLSEEEGHEEKGQRFSCLRYEPPGTRFAFEACQNHMVNGTQAFWEAAKLYVKCASQYQLLFAPCPLTLLPHCDWLVGVGSACETEEARKKRQAGFQRVKRGGKGNGQRGGHEWRGGPAPPPHAAGGREPPPDTDVLGWPQPQDPYAPPPSWEEHDRPPPPDWEQHRLPVSSLIHGGRAK